MAATLVLSSSQQICEVGNITERANDLNSHEIHKRKSQNSNPGSLMAEPALCALLSYMCVLLYSASHSTCHREGGCDNEHASGFPVQKTELKLTENKGHVLVHFTAKCRGGLQVKLNQEFCSMSLSSLRLPLVCQLYFALPSPRALEWLQKLQLTHLYIT